jgi:hypothetical protein
MIKKRNKNAEDLDENEIRHIMDVLYMLVKNSLTAHRGRVRIHVNEEEYPQRDDPCDLVQLA